MGGQSRPSDGEPDSSSPSTNTVTPTGGLPPCARNPAQCVAIRPCRQRCRARRVGRRFGRLSRRRHPLAGSPSGWTSWWAYSSTVGAPGGAACRAITARAPPSLTNCTSRKPACDNRSAVSWALRCTWSRRAGPARTDWIRTRSPDLRAPKPTAGVLGRPDRSWSPG